MKKLSIVSLSISTLIITSAAFAGSSVKNNVHHGGLYVGSGLGYLSSDLPNTLVNNGQLITLQPLYLGEVGNQSNHFNHFTATGHIGYLFPITSSFLLGVEGAYNYLPDNSYNFSADGGNIFLPLSGDKYNVAGKVKYSSYSLDLLGVAKYYITENFNMFGKVGMSYVSQTVTQDLSDSVNGTQTNAFSTQTKKSEVQPKVAAGLGYNITTDLEITVEYSHTFGDKISQQNLNQAGQNLINQTNKKPNPIVNGAKIPSNDTFLVGLNYYFNI